MFKKIRFAIFFTSLLCFLFGVSSSFAIDMGAIATDTARGDKEAPTGMSAFVVNSAGSKLFGIIYIAEGKGPHPTVFLLHGFPGNEKSLDMAQTLRRAGVNSVFFSYRGAWGSEGDFSYANCIDDTVAVVKFLQEPQTAARFRIDPAKIILTGHSMGGFVGFNVVKRLNDIKYFISFSGWNLGFYGQRLAAGNAEYKGKALAWIAGSAAPLKGTTPEKLRDEILSMKDSHDLLSFVPNMAGKKILMVGAKRDIPVPMELDHIPLYDALIKAYPNDIEEFIVDDDHAYSATRVTVTEAMLKWLKKNGF